MSKTSRPELRQQPVGRLRRLSVLGVHRRRSFAVKNSKISFPGLARRCNVANRRGQTLYFL